MSEPERHSSGAGLRFDLDAFESRLVWIFGSTRSGSTWLLRLLCHPLTLERGEGLGFDLPDAARRDATRPASGQRVSLRPASGAANRRADRNQAGAVYPGNREPILVVGSGLRDVEGFCGSLAARAAAVRAGSSARRGRACGESLLRCRRSGGGDQGGGRLPRRPGDAVVAAARSLPVPGAGRPRRDRLAGACGAARLLVRSDHEAADHKRRRPPEVHPREGDRVGVLDRRLPAGMGRASGGASADGSLRGPLGRPRRRARGPVRVDRRRARRAPRSSRRFEAMPSAPTSPPARPSSRGRPARACGGKTSPPKSSGRPRRSWASSSLPSDTPSSGSGGIGVSLPPWTGPGVGGIHSSSTSPV